MELRTLKYLVSLAQRGSFTAAAKDHYVTQPAVSIQLKKMQEELGTRLFELEGRRIRFTPAGEAALDYARRFIALEKELIRELRDMEGLQKGRLALGTIDAASIYVLPGIFSDFHDLYPGIDINLEISPTVPLLEGLGSGRLDLVVATLPVEETDDRSIIPVFSENLLPIAPPGHPLSEGGKIEANELSDYPFISFHRGSVTRRIIEDALREKGVEIRISMAIDSQEAIRNLVASGLGLAFLPEWTVREYIENGRVSPLDIKGLEIKRSLGLVMPAGRYLPSTVRAFLGVLREGLHIDLPDEYCIPVRKNDGEALGKKSR